jgi:hypothetical protein
VKERLEAKELIKKEKERKKRQNLKQIVYLVARNLLKRIRKITFFKMNRMLNKLNDSNYLRKDSIITLDL